jgi:hypothetical protein
MFLRQENKRQFYDNEESRIYFVRFEVLVAVSSNGSLMFYICTNVSEKHNASIFRSEFFDIGTVFSQTMESI